MKFLNTGLDFYPTLTVLKPHQVEALVEADIKSEDLEKIFTFDNKLPVPDIIDLAVSYYAAACKLGLPDPKWIKYLADEEIKVLLEKEFKSINRFECLKEFNSYKEFYVCSHHTGFVMAITHPGSPPPRKLKGADGWIHVVEDSFGTALLRAIYHIYGYHNVHFKERAMIAPENSFTLADVFRMIAE